MRLSMSGPVVWAAAAVCVLATCESALAQKLINAIARLQTGDEMRYVYTLETTETLTPVNNPSAVSTVTNSKQQVTVLMEVMADTRDGAIVDVTFEGFKIWMDLQERTLELDLAGPAPDEKDIAASSVYQRFRPLVGTKIRVNVSVMGAITGITGNDALVDQPAWPIFRRFLDSDLFATNLGVVFALKSDGAMPPLQQTWFHRMHLYARAARSGIWETRSLLGVAGNIATVKGSVDARGKPEDFQSRAVQFLETKADAEYAFDVSKARLMNVKRSETIVTRFLRDGVVMNSDLVGKSTLELTHDLTQVAKNRKVITPKPAQTTEEKKGTPPEPSPQPSTPPAAPIAPTTPKSDAPASEPRPR